MKHGKTALLGLLIAAALTSLGWLRQTGLAGPDVRPDPARVMVVGVRGMSWQSLLDLAAAERLPRFRALLEGDSAGADIISPGYGDPGEVLASVITGKFTHKHEVRSFGQSDLFRDRSNPGRRPVWELLGRPGDPVGVVGFPFWSPIDGPGSVVVPDWPTFSTDFRVWKNGRPAELPARWQRRLVGAEEIPRSLVERVVAGRELPEELVGALLDALAGDLTMTAIAGEIHHSAPDTQVFLYLEGLERWRAQVEAIAPRLAPALIRGYHETVEALLASLAALDGEATTFLLFSEEGNDGGAIAHRPGFPRLASWPPIGWLVAWGRGVRPGVDPLIVAPVDIAATLLYVTGSPVPNDMDGVILFGLLHDDFFHQHPVAFAPGS